MKNINLYTPEGWIDFEAIRAVGMPYTFIWSERGPGKTYGAIKSVLDHRDKHILMRRTETEMRAISVNGLSPYQPIIRDHPEYGSIEIRSIPKINAACEIVRDDEIIGYTLAMATARNIRGFDLSDCSVLVYDEFIPERHARVIKDEGTAWLNVIETINRNREILGRPPLQVYCLGNANAVDNPLFAELGLINIAYTMQEQQQQIYIDKRRGLLLVNAVGNNTYTDAKRDTSLYRLVGDNSNFASMALDNQFLGFSSDRMRSRSLRDYRIIATIGEISIYRHKSQPKYYVSRRRVGGGKLYKTGEADIKRGCQDHWYLVSAYLSDRVDCEDAASKVIFEKYYGLS